jgi:3-hexulose-6-phosphate synthase/6-phospho-3-hexuloisomerase
VVIGAPLAINPDRFQRAGGDLEMVLKQICDEVHRYGDVAVKSDFTVPWPNK